MERVSALTTAQFSSMVEASVSDSLSVQKILFLGYRFYRKPWKFGTPGGAVSVV